MQEALKDIASWVNGGDTRTRLSVPGAVEWFSLLSAFQITAMQNDLTTKGFQLLLDTLQRGQMGQSPGNQEHRRSGTGMACPSAPMQCAPMNSKARTRTVPLLVLHYKPG